MLNGTSVAIVGGSIAGCAAAIALQRAGCEVTVFERSTELQDRGSGIATPIPLRDELIDSGYIDANYATWRMAHRRWLIDDGGPDGRLLWLQKSEAAANNWGNLWRSLRAHVPDESYRAGISVDSIHETTSGVTIETSDGERSTFDALVGADGYRSHVRGRLVESSTPEFAGYVLWRGNYEESRVADRSGLDRADEDFSWITTVFPGGHGVLYMIPGFDDSAEVGHRRVNWAVYAPTPAGWDFDDPTSIPPGQISPDLYSHFDALLTEHFPSYFEELVRLSPRQEVSLQPIYDEALDRYAAGRLMLIGDAGTVTRPHTGSGATKALQDALALERLAIEGDSWDQVAAAYSEERAAAGNTLVELGRRIGHAQVTNTPEWDTMTVEDFEAWTAATLAGEDLYFWGSTEAREGVGQ